MSDKLRCAVIGTGAIGVEHMKSLARCPHASLVAIAESDPKRAKEAADQHRLARSYSNYHELLDQPDIDAVTIALPNHLHASAALEALGARKHVLLERPMTLKIKDALKVFELAKKMKRTLMVAQPFRFNRHTQTAKDLIERAQIGDVYHARGFWLRRCDIPKFGSWYTQKQQAGGGCTFDLGSLMVDTCLHLMGDFDVVSVSAHMHSKLGPRGVGSFDLGKGDPEPKKGFDVEDYSTALLRLRKGKSIALELSWAAHHPLGQREYGIDLLGTTGGISLFPARLYRDGLSGYETVELTPNKLPYAEDGVHHFVSCVLQGKKPMITSDEALKTQQILEALYLSAANGKEVVIK